MEDKDSKLKKIFNRKQWRRNYFAFNNKKFKDFTFKVFDETWIGQKSILSRFIDWIKSIFIKNEKC